MNEVKETGGARVGMANATWPFATLIVTKEKLELNATILGNFIFMPTDIISIEPSFGFLKNGLKIKHNIPKYKNKLVFYTFGDSNVLLKRIEQTGFLNNHNPIPLDLKNKILLLQSTRGGPIKISAAIVIVIIWNICFIMDFQKEFNLNLIDSKKGLGAQMGLGFILTICILLLTLEPARKIILKEGRSINDIKIFIYFAMFISGVMFLASSVIQK